MQHLGGAKIKNLQVLITKKELEQERLKDEFNALQSRRDKLSNQIKKYKEEIESLKSSTDSIIVSEHAILRYLQRVYELDIAKIEAEIVSPKLYSQVKEYGSGTYHSDGFSIKVVDGVVVTVIEESRQ